jgi:protein-S-isoprenylcysteine O-methyltransferase Ste14
MVTLVIPALILWRSGVTIAVVPATIGIGLILAGLALVVWTVKLFVTEGRGTLAPWDPTSRLVVRGPYRHVRNPMISGVGTILAGEALLFGSWGLGVLLAIFVAANAIYFPLVEEPGLSRRFGSDYEEYRRHVPRWMPRLRPWRS